MLPYGPRRNDAARVNTSLHYALAEETLHVAPPLAWPSIKVPALSLLVAAAADVHASLISQPLIS